MKKVLFILCVISCLGFTWKDNTGSWVKQNDGGKRDYFSIQTVESIFFFNWSIKGSVKLERKDFVQVNFTEYEIFQPNKVVDY